MGQESSSQGRIDLRHQQQPSNVVRNEARITRDNSGVIFQVGGDVHFHGAASPKADARTNRLRQDEDGGIRSAGPPRTNCADKLENIQAALKTMHRQRKLHGLPWMREVGLSPDGYVDLLLRTRLGKRTHLSNIFERETVAWYERWLCPAFLKNRKAPSRILVEGPAGSGKTTLAAKICFDWAAGERYTSEFSLVIMVLLRRFDGDIRNVLAGSAGVAEAGGSYTVDDVITLLRAERRSKALLVLDGFDELSSGNKEALYPYLRKTLLPHVTILVTARPGTFDGPKAQDAVDFDEISLNTLNCFDQRIHVEGLSQLNQKEFLRRTLPNAADYSHARLSSLRTKLSELVGEDMLNCPLFLLMLVEASRDGDITTMRNKTDLYKKVLNSMLKRHLARCLLGRNSDHAKPTGPRTGFPARIGQLSNFDAVNFFDFDADEKPAYVTMLSKFGELALTALIADKLFFSEREIAGSCDDPMTLDIGFLTKITCQNGLIEETWYEPVHKTMIEFCAAYALWVGFLERGTKAFAATPNRDYIKMFRPLKYESSLVFPFLSGLMGENAFALFDRLRPFASEYKEWFGSLGSSLLECQVSERLLASLDPLLPIRWMVPWHADDWRFSTSAQCSQILEHWNKVQKPKFVSWNSGLSTFKFPHGFEVDRLFITFIIGSKNESYETSTTNRITCKELWCSLFYGHPHSHVQYEIWELILASVVDCEFVFNLVKRKWPAMVSFIGSIKFDSMSFYVGRSRSGHWIPLIRDAVIDGPLAGAKLHSLTVRNVPERYNVEPILDMVRSNRLAAMDVSVKTADFDDWLGWASGYLSLLLLFRLSLEAVHDLSMRRTPFWRDGLDSVRFVWTGKLLLFFYHIFWSKRTRAQQNLVTLLSCPARADRLRKFVLSYDRPMTVSRRDGVTWNSMLHAEVPPPAKWLQIRRVDLRHTENIFHSIRLEHLDIGETSFELSRPCSVLYNCEAESLSCGTGFLLTHGGDCAHGLVSSVSELEIVIDQSSNEPVTRRRHHYHETLKLGKLRIVAYNLRSAAGKNIEHTPLLRLLSVEADRLLGVEIWMCEANPQLSSKIISSILDSVKTEKDDHQCRAPHKDVSTPNTETSGTEETTVTLISGVRRLQYIMLLTTACNESGGELVTFLSALKNAWPTSSFAELWIVFQKSVVDRPVGRLERRLRFLSGTFPSEEGFRVEYDLYGMRDTDGVRAKNCFQSLATVTYHRYTVSRSSTV